MQLTNYANSVFINCPFDKDYEPLLQSIVFTIFRCGFIPRSAMEEEDSSEIRLEKIIRLVAQCKYGIHDISKTGLDIDTDFPRFNMPFELGLFWWAKKFGDKQQKEKIALIFEKQKYGYQKYLSDINGVDIRAHENKQEIIIKSVCNWLRTSSGRKTIPNFSQVLKDYKNFVQTSLPQLLVQSHTQNHDLTFNDYCAFVSTALEARMKMQR